MILKATKPSPLAHPFHQRASGRHASTLSAMIGLLAAVGSATVACDENPTNPPVGEMNITTSAPTVEKEVVTSDGWSIKFDRFLVHMPLVNVAGKDDLVVAATSTPQIIDQVAPGPKSILLATVRTARAWEDVSFQIGPATADATPLDPVKEADRDAMAKEGFSIYFEAKATNAAKAVTKTLKIGIKTDTMYSACEGDLNGARVPGLIVPADGTDTADVAMGGDVLFSDDLASGILRGESFATADADNDGLVTTSELHALPLDVVRTSTGAPYHVGAEHADVTDLGAFVDELARSIVKSFRSPNGKCTAAAVAAAATPP